LAKAAEWLKGSVRRKLPDSAPGDAGGLERMVEAASDVNGKAIQARADDRSSAPVLCPIRSQTPQGLRSVEVVRGS
jgi:hypothetical protein